ncbi:hypothetical protein GS518_07555 [Leptospira interrogans]|nr:hypothetical protein A6J42_20115 [Leptospira interrogans serovar Copenhageni]EJP04058.1 hypothetical protein LEP1GSC007_2986 [Leptospira interrogans serovar Bulgarica str. Mallika]EKP23266.1 hypothetical protein LEP1GSC117_2874 [Leptospira interrogans serovar Icterohaemorrhagiae str. Verdun LP]EKP77264.1 hypothetical protein LEP1GSC173_2533 [Leptospira interrogans str. HAI1594]EMO16819.1 hypothetical protein LEP1GSC167_1766 [Leptospira interrogans serovar Copenhageni str. HAI0188]EMO37226.1
MQKFSDGFNISKIRSYKFFKILGQVQSNPLEFYGIYQAVSRIADVSNRLKILNLSYNFR